MKLPILFKTLTLVGVLGFPGELRAQDVFWFDFGGDPTTMGPSPDDPVNFWNHVDGITGTSDAGILTDVLDSVGNTTTGMNLEMVRRFSGTNQSGDTASVLFPGNATRDSLYGHTEEFSGRSNVFPAFKLTGLDSALSYDFTFYASRLGVGDNRETEYTLTGANADVVLLNPANNDLDKVTVSTGIQPNASGEILIELGPGGNNDNEPHFTYLGFLKVESSPASGDIVITSDPESVTVTEYDPVTFRVTATGAGPYVVKWFENGVEIPGATEFTYHIPEASLAQNGLSYTATVSNDTSSETSAAALLTVEADVVLPEVLSVRASGSMALELTFSEPLDAVNGVANSSYSVSDTEGNVGIVSASFSDQGTKVQLVVDRQIVGDFTVSVAGVTDRAGNSVEPTQNTISGTATAPGTVTYLVDFGGAAIPNDPVNTWNLLSTDIGRDDNGVLANISSSSGEASGVSIQMISRFNGVNRNGSNSSDLFPVEATSDSLYGNTEEWQGLTDIIPSFKLTGLDINKSYTLTFYAARLGVGDNRETKYSVVGGDGEVSVLFDPANNLTDETVSIEEVYPDGAGEITVTLSPGGNNNNAYHFTYLNALRIDAQPGSPQGLRITDFQFDPANNNVTISWVARTSASYSVFYTDDLADLEKYGEVDDSIIDNGPSDHNPEPGLIQFQFPNPASAGPRSFFSVHRNP